VVFVLGVLAALCNAVSTVLQKQGVQQASAVNPARPGRVVGLLRRPAWLLGILALIGSFLLHAAALGHGELATVQLLLATELLFVLVILVGWFGQRLGVHEWIGAAGLVLGVAGFLLFSSPHGGRASASTAAWVLAAALAAAFVSVAVLFGRASYGSRPAAYIGAAAAVAFAITAALVKAAVTTLEENGLVALLSSWPPYALAVTGAGAVLLSGMAFQRGSIAAAQASLSAVDPLVSIAIGVLLFGEELRSGAAAVTLQTLSLVVMIAGVVVLSSSPTIFRAEQLPAS
jgi:drug/metabolite transporter (DMT)-like permease